MADQLLDFLAVCRDNRETMNGLNLTRDDLFNHVIQATIEFDPPLRLDRQRQTLSRCAEEVARCSPEHDLSTRIGPDGLRISKPQPDRPAFILLRVDADEAAFALAVEGRARPGGALQTAPDYRRRFAGLRNVFFGQVSEAAPVNLLVLRQLDFHSGLEPASSLMTARGAFDGLAMSDVGMHLQFRDDRFDVQVMFNPEAGDAKTPRPLAPSRGADRSLAVQVMVKFRNPRRPLTDADIEEALDRSDCLWPDEIMTYVNSIDGDPS